MRSSGPSPPRTAGARSGWVRSRWERFDADGRMPGIDLARGSAVVGMFAAHMLPLPPLMWTVQSTWHGIADGRSSILFAVLAGVSIALVSGGASPIPRRQAATARIRMLARAGCIWLLGIALALTPVPVYVILPAYGLLFLLAIPALRWRAPALFGTAATIALVGPFIVHAANASAWWETESGGYAATALGWHYPVPLWAAFIAAGMGIGRLRLDDWRVLIALLCSGTALAVIGYAVIAPASRSLPWGQALTDAPHSSGLGESVGSGGFAVAVVAACVLACRTPARWLAIPLRAVGAMPLTAYTAQFVVWWAATSGEAAPLGAFRDLEPFWPFTLCTIAVCTAWTLLIGRGPLELAIGAASRAAAGWGSGTRMP
ncbi:DUF1624 domain-containing protein [Microbacterium sp. JB110]|nr:DUF1624 domain-containing protein [Microbacterium sp. JB110]SJM69037.1 Putative membrane protein [Frigoribacterium sp. JB110]